MHLTRVVIYKIVLIILLVTGVGMFALRSEAVGTTFATHSGQGKLDLKIDSTTYYNGELQPRLSWELKNLVPWRDKFFYFRDVKPGDTGVSTISVHVRKSPAWVCLDFRNLQDREHGHNEPESLVDTNWRGELSGELEFFAWHDDGDNEFEIGEEPLFGTSTQSAKQVLKGQSYAIVDSRQGNPQQPGETRYVGITWCAGDLLVDLGTATIDGDGTFMGNEAQTDIMRLDVALRAVPADVFSEYTCRTPKHYGGGHYGSGGHGQGGDGDDLSCQFDDNHNDDAYPLVWEVKEKGKDRSGKNTSSRFFGGWFNTLRQT